MVLCPIPPVEALPFVDGCLIGCFKMGGEKRNVSCCHNANIILYFFCSFFKSGSLVDLQHHVSFRGTVCCFLMYAFIVMNFSVSTAFTVPNKFWFSVFHFCLSVSIF